MMRNPLLILVVLCFTLPICQAHIQTQRLAEDTNGTTSEQYISTTVHTPLNPNCTISINTTSALILKNELETYEPNLGRFELRFRYEHEIYIPYILEPSTSFTDDIILPYQWVWTYFDVDKYFPYLKWPVDFSLLSFHLLDTKTTTKQFLVVELDSFDCRVTLGTKNTTLAIGLALRNLTLDYLLPLKRSYSVSYWCFLVVVPGIKDTIAYQLGIHIAFPVEFERYNCCRTLLSKVDNQSLSIDCDNHNLVPKMWQCTIIPYVLGLITFAYFPILLFKTSAGLKSTGIKAPAQPLLMFASSEHNIENEGEDVVYLDGSPPISISIIVGGLCGLADRHPVAVSRLRRLIFVLFGPCVIFCQLAVYHRYNYEMVMALLDHGRPMGYLSMLGGFEKSKSNFLPLFGGPYFLLLGFYVAGILFLMIPKHLDRIAYDGTLRYTKFGEMSPLFLNNATIEKLSHVSVCNIACGYKRSAELGLAMFYMIVNPAFWCNAVRIQYSRIKTATGWRCKSTWSKVLVCIFILPFYIVLCLPELALCVLYYGIPLINNICIVVTGYIVWMSTFCRRRCDVSDSKINIMFGNLFTKVFLAIIITCMFIYYVFSFCTVFILSFSFLAEIVVFCFIAVIVYPSTSFGYLFFGVIFLYYIFKIFQGFGHGYLELLADAVEISTHLENDIYRNHVVNGTIVIDGAVSNGITKLQVRNRIIQLTNEQCRAIGNTNIRQRAKIYHRGHTTGIPRELFMILVKKYRPVHIYITHALIKIFLILALIYVTLSMILVKPFESNEGMSEVMHVIFIVAIGALPRILEVAMDNIDHVIKKDIHLRELKSIISDYWTS